MLAAKLITAIAVLVAGLAAQEALAQGSPPNQQTAPGRSAATNPAPAAQPTRTPLPFFPAIVGDTTMKLPYFNNHCGLDEQQAFDREFLQAARAKIKDDQILVAVTARCDELERVRANPSGGFDFILYLGVNKPLSATLTRATAARAICDALGAGPLTKTTPKERAQELYDLGKASAKEEAGRLDVTERACYLGSMQKDASGLTSQAIALTPVNGKLLTIAASSFNGAQLPALLNLSYRLINETVIINGGK